MDFSGMHIIVTGGTGALGTEVVRLLTKAGAVCHIPNFDAAELARFPLKDDPNLRYMEGVDLTDEDSVAGFYGKHPTLWASIHIAGGFAMSPIAETGADDFARMMNMNALSCFLCCREAVKQMRAGGAGSGRIVNISARPALEPRSAAGMIPYAASKAAVATITQALAEEVAGENILVNAVVPSVIDTAQNRADMPKADHAKWPKPTEIAATIAFLASPANQVTRGGLVPVYGKS